MDDLADAIVHLIGLDNPPDWVNVGTGVDLTILELAQLVAQTVGFEGGIEIDPTRPDGTPVKCTDVTRLHALGGSTGWDLQRGSNAPINPSYPRRVPVSYDRFRRNKRN